MYVVKGEKTEDDRITKGHYVTVTGLQIDKISGEIWLRVSSWGRTYYIDFNEYQQFINDGVGRNITSNILYIERK